MANAILVIAPYWDMGTWVFDDPAVGLHREPFVSGVPEMIDELVQDLPDARRGFRLTFSAMPFPGYQQVVTWVREEDGGHWSHLSDPLREGWLCPALFRYFAEAPPRIYVKAEPLERPPSR